MPSARSVSGRRDPLLWYPVCGEHHSRRVWHSRAGYKQLRDRQVPGFLEDPLEAVGTVMVLTGLVMMAILSGLWYTAEKRDRIKKHKTKRLQSAPHSPPRSYSHPA
ncbi:uncharacterized protein LOC135224438 [Macrobrachium nipponense]|uniref:uncharacterized protein LOC135224438 n=1 Tax=Macrobrachium nipponense TaxID=159736 RepID=UPI0030C887AF